MFCTKCGVKNPEDATFCYKCGNEMKVIKDKKMTEKPKSFHDNVQNKTSLLKNKKWLYVIVAVAVLLLGFGGYKWYNRNAFAKAVDGHIYKVTDKTVAPKNSETTHHYVAYKIHGKYLYEFYTIDGGNDNGRKEILKHALRDRDIYNVRSKNYDKDKNYYSMRMKDEEGEEYDYNGDYYYNNVDIYVVRNSLNMDKTYDAYHDVWTKTSSKEKYKLTKNGYTSNVKGKKITTTITATRVD